MRTYSSTAGTNYTVTYDQAGYSEDDAAAHHWSAVTPAGEVIAELWVQIDDERHDASGVDFVAGQIIQVETAEDYQREGIATQLYRIAEDQLGEIIHSAPEHRTAEGDAFAAAVGGESR